jgi:hypothetical protein
MTALSFIHLNYMNGKGTPFAHSNTTIMKFCSKRKMVFWTFVIGGIGGQMWFKPALTKYETKVSSSVILWRCLCSGSGVTLTEYFLDSSSENASKVWFWEALRSFPNVMFQFYLTTLATKASSTGMVVSNKGIQQ